MLYISSYFKNKVTTFTKQLNLEHIKTYDTD